MPYSLVAEAADNLRFCHATSSEAKLRTFVSFVYKAGSWQQSLNVVARLECSLQPVPGETGMRLARCRFPAHELRALGARYRAGTADGAGHGGCDAGCNDAARD
jgi:hypothetical protein